MNNIEVNSKIIFDNNLSLEDNVINTFKYNKLNRVSSHTQEVVEYSIDLAKKYKVSICQVKSAALLHDISGIIANDDKVQLCKENNLNLFKEEIKYPMLTHQRLSVIVAKMYFKVFDEEVLSAIGCHTTLKKEVSTLDLIIFIADKIKWDQDGQAPYLSVMLEALEMSLEACALSYINYIIDHNMIMTPHPWLLEAREYLSEEIKYKNFK